MPPVSHTPDDDDRWQQQLLASDPARPELASAEFAAAVARLEAVAERCWSGTAPMAVGELQPTLSHARPAEPRPRQWLWRLLAAALILGAGLAVTRSWWIASEPTPETATVTDGPATLAAADDREARPAVVVPEALSREAAPKVAVVPGPRGTPKIQTVAELVKLPPSQLARVQRQLDRAALDHELQTWLRQWHDGSPDQRRELEQIWIGRRGFWAGWTLQGLRTWTDPSVLRAGVEVMSLELGSQAAAGLAFCWDRAETRSSAAVFLVPLATDVQLAQWLPQATDRDQVVRVLAELVRRPSESATELLATLAVDTDCQPVLRDPSLAWNSVHAQRALAALAANQPQTQFRAAMLLTVLDGNHIDQELLQKIRSGGQTLPAMAVWLLRHPGDSQGLATHIQNSPLALAVVPSANQRAQKWSRQQRSESSGPWSFRKVCQLCVTAS